MEGIRYQIDIVKPIAAGFMSMDDIAAICVSAGAGVASGIVVHYILPPGFVIRVLRDLHLTR